MGVSGMGVPFLPSVAGSSWTPLKFWLDMLCEKLGERRKEND
jgi:hypothetical protein